MRVTITALLLIFAIAHSNAQIAYTDVNPDTKFSCSKEGCSHQYNLDLNNDGINDFTLAVVSEYAGVYCTSRGNNSSVSITPLNSNEVVGFNYASKLLADSIIGDQSMYYDTLGRGNIIRLEYFYWQHVEHQGCYGWKLGSWSSSTDGYLGLKLEKAGRIYYGWARLSVSVSSTSASFTIKDYAYNSAPKRPILAGEKSCSSPSVTLSANGPLSFCAGDSVILTANGTGYLYQWKKNGTNIRNATLRTYVAKTAGTYSCKVTNSCGIKISKADTIQISCKTQPGYAATLQEKISNQAVQLQVAPNPFSNTTFINYTLPQKFTIAQIIITDKNGKTLKVVRISGSSKGSLKVDASTLASGVYQCAVMIDGKLVDTKQLVLSK